MKNIKYLIFIFICLFIFNIDVFAKEGNISCSIAPDGLNLRSSIGGGVTGYLTCGNSLEVLDENAGTTAGVCDKWYKVKSNNKEYYACGDYITIKEELSKEEITDYKAYLKEKGFPDSYLDSLVSLHEKYPNWEFEVFKADISFDNMVSIEYQKNGKSLLWDNNGSYDGYKSVESWAYNYLTDKFRNDYSGGGVNWYAPSYNTVAYYLDPRNFLNEKQIFMFETLGYNSAYHTIEGVEKMLVNTFMEGKYADSENTKTYAEAFIDAGIKNNVSPYLLVSRVIQEVGSKGSTIVSGTVEGYEGYYNFYNIKATGSQDSIIKNGLEHAKKMGWDSPYKAIVGGGDFLDKDYISQGQDTLYLQKWDLFGPLFGNHQYQQNIQAPSTESIATYNGYNKSGLLDSPLVFKIPVFTSIPSVTKLDSSGNPNNYLKTLKVNGEYLFSEAVHDTTFDLEYEEDVTSLKIEATTVNSKSIISGVGTIALNSAKQSIVVSVMAENGAVRDYVINVKRNVTSLEPDDKEEDNNNNKDDKENEKEEIKEEEKVITIKEVLEKLKYTYDDNYFYKFSVGTKIETIINNIKNIDNSISVSSYNKDSKEKTSGVIANGDIITIKTKNEEKSYRVILYGDVNSDGVIDKLDALAILRGYYGYIKMTDLEKKSSDINKDNNIDKLDALAVLRDYYGYAKIEQ